MTPTHYTVTFLEANYTELIDFLFQDYSVERAALLRCRVAATDRETRFLVRTVHLLDGDDLNHATPEDVSIKSTAFMRVLKLADTNHEVVVFVHSHPGGFAAFSHQDDRTEPPFFRTAFNRIRDGAVHGSVIFMNPGQFVGRTWLSDGTKHPIEMIRIIGNRWHFVTNIDQSARIPEFYDRQVRAFGSDMQHTLQQLTIGVVGAGGTGSAVIEQLVRLGVGTLIVFDDQDFEYSNINRVYNSRTADDGKPKVSIVQRLVEETGLGTRVVTVKARITEEQSAKLLRDCDVIFGCTDDQLGRSVLNDISLRYYIPVIDVAVIIDSDDDQRIRSITGRVTTLLPGNACLFCRGRLSTDHIRWEGMHPEELERQRGLGYAPALGNPAPAVITFTSGIATSAVNEFLNRLTGFVLDDAVPSEIMHSYHLRKIIGTLTPPNPDCMCQDRHTWGSGDTRLFLDRTWPIPTESGYAE